jgi:hypothetical protein
MTLTIRRLAASLTIGGCMPLVGFSLGHASGQKQPNMGAALEHLRAARASLDKSLPDKAGHRLTAIGLVDQAIAELQAGIKAGR